MIQPLYDRPLWLYNWINKLMFETLFANFYTGVRFPHYDGTAKISVEQRKGYIY